MRTTVYRYKYEVLSCLSTMLLLKYWQVWLEWAITKPRKTRNLLKPVIVSDSRQTLLTNKWMNTVAKGFMAIDSPLYKSWRSVMAASLWHGLGRRSACWRSRIMAHPTANQHIFVLTLQSLKSYHYQKYNPRNFKY